MIQSAFVPVLDVLVDIYVCRTKKKDPYSRTTGKDTKPSIERTISRLLLFSKILFLQRFFFSSLEQKGTDDDESLEQGGVELSWKR